MNNDNQHDASLERAGGMFPPLIKIEDDNLPMELLHLPTLRAVVPLGWALPPHVYAGEVIKRADRLLNAYYGADPAQCWTAGGSTAYVYSQGNQSWLVVMPDPNSVARAFSTTLKAHVKTLARFDVGADQSSQAEVLTADLLALGLGTSGWLDALMIWQNSLAGDGNLCVSSGIWSVWPVPRRNGHGWYVTLGTDCYQLMRGDPATLRSDATEEALMELSRAVSAVSILSGGGPAGISVDAPDALRPLVRLRVLPRDGSTPLLTPEEALCRVANGFPGSELATWASVRSPSLVEHAVESSHVSLSLRRLLFLNGRPRSPREVVEDLVRAARTAELDAYSAEVVVVGARGDKVLRLERAENKAGSASLAEALLEIASDDCSECVAWCEAFELVPLSRGCWRGRLCLENGRWCLWLRTSRHAMLETGLPPGDIARELRAAGKLVEELFLGGSMLVADAMAGVEVCPAAGTEYEDIRTAAAWMVTDWLTYSFPDGDSDGDLLRYLDRRRQAIVAADSDNNSNNDKEA